jgi:hypothetical protein
MVSNAVEYVVIASGQTSNLCIDAPSASVRRQISSNSTRTIGEDCVNSMKLLAIAQISSARNVEKVWQDLRGTSAMIIDAPVSLHIICSHC